jgi:hypothetical protein
LLAVLRRPDNHHQADCLAVPLTISSSVPRTAETPAPGIIQEVVDPIAAEVLEKNPKAFVLGKKGKR